MKDFEENPICFVRCIRKKLDGEKQTQEGIHYTKHMIDLKELRKRTKGKKNSKEYYQMIVELHYLASSLTWWQSVLLTWTCAILIKGNASLNESKSKEDK